MLLLIGCQEITQSRYIIFSTQQSVRIPLNIAFFLSQPLKPMPAKKPSLYFHTCKRMRKHIFFCRKSFSTDGSIKKKLIKKAIVRAIPIFWGEWELSFYSATGSASIWPTLLFGPRFAFFLLQMKSRIPRKG